MKQGFLLLLVGLLLAFASCKNRQQQDQGPRYRGMDQSELQQKHKESHLVFQTLTLKGKADYNNATKNENLSFSYKVCVAKDSLIWANITKLGLPAATILLDQDSVRMRLPLTREAVLCDYTILSKMVGMELGFETLQSFLVGDGGMPDSALLVSGNETPIELRSARGSYQVSWFLNSTHFKLEKMTVKDRILGAESSLEYSDFKKVSGQTVPALMRLVTTSPTSTRIELKHSDIQLDSDDATFSFRIPDGYQVKPCELK